MDNITRLKNVASRCGQSEALALADDASEGLRPIS